MPGMLRTCCDDFSDVFSPRPQQVAATVELSAALERSLGVSSRAADDASERPELSASPPVLIDDSISFQALLFETRRSLMRTSKRWLSARVSLAMELALLFAVLLQIVVLVALHSLVMPSPLVPEVAGSLAPLLTSTLLTGNGTSEGVAIELLRVIIEAPEESTCRGAWCSHFFPAALVCEFAAERPLLELPAAARERAYRAGGAATTSMRVGQGGGTSWVERVVPGLARSVAPRRLLAALVRGPLREDARRREKDAVGAFEAAEHAAMAAAFRARRAKAAGDAAAEVAGRLQQVIFQGAGRGADTKAEPAANVSATGGAEAASNRTLRLQFVSCGGGRPRSMQPLERAAELQGRSMEWWLFKLVWMFSSVVLGFLVATAAAHTARSALLALFRLSRACAAALASRRWPAPEQQTNMLEWIVTICLPALLAFALCRLAGDLDADVCALLLAFVCAEVFSLVVVATEESRYILPRSLLPVYVADVYYTCFHPFGFTWLAHGSLWCFQGFIMLVLWSHFETQASLPCTSTCQLLVEARLRPKPAPPVDPAAPTPTLQPLPPSGRSPMLAPGDRPRAQAGSISEPTQRLLLEQGLLLLGNDQSYEAGLVMGAVISRALQAIKVPRSHDAGALAERMEPLRPLLSAFSRLTGALDDGVATRTLVARSSAGDRRCERFVQHLLTRVPAPRPQRVFVHYGGDSGSPDIHTGQAPHIHAGELARGAAPDAAHSHESQRAPIAWPGRTYRNRYENLTANVAGFEASAASSFERRLRSVGAEALASALRQPRRPPPSQAAAASAWPAQATFVVTLERPAEGARLGVDVDPTDGCMIVITSISQDGLVSAWNRANPDQPIREGDRILGVNGKQGVPVADLLATLRSEQTLRVTLLRAGSCIGGDARRSFGDSESAYFGSDSSEGEADADEGSAQSSTGSGTAMQSDAVLAHLRLRFVQVAGGRPHSSGGGSAASGGEEARGKSKAQDDVERAFEEVAAAAGFSASAADPSASAEPAQGLTLAEAAPPVEHLAASSSQSGAASPSLAAHEDSMRAALVEASLRLQTTPASFSQSDAASPPLFAHEGSMRAGLPDAARLNEASTSVATRPTSSSRSDAASPPRDAHDDSVHAELPDDAQPGEGAIDTEAHFAAPAEPPSGPRPGDDGVVPLDAAFQSPQSDAASPSPGAHQDSLGTDLADAFQPSDGGIDGEPEVTAPAEPP
mmetsp:Transcript_51632/g.167720  ORF Transcript_51632/g.167720 Transcript_51632/m.167720 type:complete len:1210 (-) Transcript_51632:251-3880(-)